MRAVVLLSALWLPRPAMAAEPEVSLHVGRLWFVDRDVEMFDGPEVAVRFGAPVAASFAAVAEIGSDGDFAGADGTCLGRITGRGGVSGRATIGPRWLSVRGAAGLGLGWARLYAAPYFRSQGADGIDLAWGDRLVPEGWASAALAAEVGEDLFVQVETRIRLAPQTRFRPDHVPRGMRSEHYPTFGREYALSTAGASVGVGWRF